MILRNYARKRRQLKFLAKQIRKLLAANGGELTVKIERMIGKLKRILQNKNAIISGRDLRKVLGAAAVLFGLGLSTSATAQNFALPEVKPFGMDSIKDYSIQAFADLDDDGDLDLFVAQYGDSGVYSAADANFLYFENTGTLGTPAFGTSPLVNPFGTSIAYGIDFVAPSFADLDGDGDQDLISGSNSGEFHYFENTGSATAPEFQDAQINPFGLDSVYYISFPEFVDLDGDGDFDLISGEAYYDDVSEMDLGNFVFFENVGTANAPAFADPVKNPFGLSPTLYFNFPSVADIDGDGDIDILSGEYYGQLKYFENVGSATAPQFTNPVASPFGIVIDPETDLILPSLDDLDNDGDIDLFVFNDNGVGSFYENTVRNPVNVKELAPAFELEAFPNPVEDRVYLKTAEDIDQVEVIDLLGRTLKVFYPIHNAIGLQELHPGVYTLRVMDKNGNFMVRKIQKL